MFKANIYPNGVTELLLNWIYKFNINNYLRDLQSSAVEKPSFESAPSGLDHSCSSHFSSFASTLTVAVLPTPAGPVSNSIGGNFNNE